MKRYSHKVHLFKSLIKGPLKKLNDRFPSPFIYLNLCNIYPFIYLKPEKGTHYPFWVEPPHKGHYREYSPPPPYTHPHPHTHPATTTPIISMQRLIRNIAKIRGKRYYPFTLQQTRYLLLNSRCSTGIN